MTRRYRVFLVEDEIVTREGIRDRVNWLAAGFEFCGEAPDGEIALPLIQATHPDILITDIKMPFMNGLELCKIVHETLPEIKTVILSGHDEFAYAQEAIKLCVTEYLLKPVSPEELVAVLKRIAAQIEQANEERERLLILQEQFASHLPELHEKFLRQLLLGRIPVIEAIRESIQIKLSLIARGYLVVFLKIEFPDGLPAALTEHYSAAEQIIAKIARRNADVLVSKMGLGESVLIFKGDSIDHLRQDGDLLVEAIREDVHAQAGGQLRIGISRPCEHLSDISQVFFEAFWQVSTAPKPEEAPAQPAGPIELARLDPQATETFLKYGSMVDFERYFQDYIRPIPVKIQSTRQFLDYILMDILITTANFVSELGGDPGKVIPELTGQSSLTASSLQAATEQVRGAIAQALAFRDTRPGTQYGALIAQARHYIDSHFEDPEISLKMVAARVNLSPSHFSVVFSRETGGTFIEYLTQMRIEKAMLLLSSTHIKAAEIAARVGYDNPHYFSTVFKKITGFTPSEYRSKMQRAA